MSNLSKYTVAIFLLLAGSLVWVGNAVGAKPAKVMVTSTAPENALQGDSLDLVISGSGFGHGSTVRLLVSGTNDDTQVEITGVALFDEVSGDLVVPIHVLEAATVDFYDVEVRTSSGRRGKGTDLFKVEPKEGGNVNPTFDVTFSDDLSGSSGTNWQSSSDGHGLDYWRSEPLGGTGEINLDYFRIPSAQGGPFVGTRGENCFGTDSSTPMEGVQLWEESRSGDPILNLTFFGTTEDGAITFKYHLQLKGVFDDPGDWLPLDWTTVTMTSWKLRIAAKNLRKKYSNISCVGEGDFDTTIWVGRNQ